MCILDILQFESTSFFLCVPILGLILTYCFLGVIKALYNKSNIICCVVKVHQWCKPWLRLIVIEWKSIHYFACGLEIPLSITERNLAYTGIMEGMRQKFRSLRFWEGNIRSSLWQKRLDFCLEINKFWVRVWSLPKEKYELLKIWTNIKFTKFSEKASSVVTNGANQRVKSIPPTLDFNGAWFESAQGQNLERSLKIFSLHM